MRGRELVESTKADKQAVDRVDSALRHGGNDVRSMFGVEVDSVGDVNDVADEVAYNLGYEVGRLGGKRSGLDALYAWASAKGTLAKVKASYESGLADARKARHG